MQRFSQISLVIFGLVILGVGGFFAWNNSNSFSYSSEKNLQSIDLESNDLMQKDPEELSVLFVGDMMFDRAVRKKAQLTGFDSIFGDSSKIFEGNDLVIGNLEGPITTNQSKTLLPDGSQSKVLTFTFPTSTAQALKNVGFDIVSLANNHSDNFGPEGLRQTKKYLNDVGLQYFGEPTNNGEISTTTCKYEICIGLIGYHEFTYQNEEKILAEIARMRPTVDYIVMLPHWGDEYNKSFAVRQQNLAHKWIDAGVDLIIGAHPHVIEPIETYKGKQIFYSLGNYIFDQYFSFDTTHGITVKVIFPKDKTKEIATSIIPISNVGMEVKIPDQVTTDKILREIKRIP